MKERGGSAHSDYFSLSDENSIEVQEAPKNVTNNRTETMTEKHDRECQVDLMSSMCKTLDLRPKSANFTCVRPVSPSPRLCFQETNPFPYTSSFPAKRFGDYYPFNQIKSGSKVSNLLEKLKGQKAACDTSSNFIWRDIHKHHKELFANDDEMRSCDTRSTQRSVTSSQSVSTTRSRSLDRMSSSRQSTANELRALPNVSKLNCTSLDNLSVASTEKNQSCNKYSVISPNKYHQGPLPSTSNNYRNNSSLIESASRLSESLPELDLSSSEKTSSSTDSLNKNEQAVPDLPYNHRPDKNFTSQLKIKNDYNECNKQDTDLISEINGESKVSSTPVIAKREAPFPVSF